MPKKDYSKVLHVTSKVTMIICMTAFILAAIAVGAGGLWRGAIFCLICFVIFFLTYLYKERGYKSPTPIHPNLLKGPMSPKEKASLLVAQSTGMLIEKGKNGKPLPYYMVPISVSKRKLMITTINAIIDAKELPDECNIFMACPTLVRIPLHNW